MMLDVDYLDTYLYITDENILNVEIENKKYFYRIIHDFYQISVGNELDYVKCINHDKEEMLAGKISVFTDYFNFDLKKHVNMINKYLINHIEDCDKQVLVKLYNQLWKKYKSIIHKIDLPIILSDECNLELFIKSAKININLTDDLLNNLLVIIDIEKELSLNKILIFVNLKQYLTKLELSELYKYALYNNVKILLMDSQSYGPTEKYEKKIIIDENLVEFVL